MRLCRTTIKENSTLWKDGKEERKLERGKIERLATVRRKKEERRENEIHKKNTNNLAETTDEGEGEV